MLSLPDFKERQLVVCYAREGQRVSFKNDNLLVTDAEGVVRLQRSCHRIFGLWIVGQTSLTSGILERSRKFGFPILLFSYGHRLYGTFRNPTEGNVWLRRQQYQYDSLDLPKRLVWNKIANQRALLKGIRKKGQGVKDAIEGLEVYMEKLHEATDFRMLLGLEGSGSRLFFTHWFQDLPWRGRKPRTKIDPINVILDMGYTYLFCMMEGLLDAFGFDLYQGVYHKAFYERKSLVCDLVEPFRCIIDRQVKKAWNLGQLNPQHFIVSQGFYQLKWEHHKTYTKWLLEALLEEKQSMFSYVQTYYRSFMRQSPIEAYPTFLLNERSC